MAARAILAGIGLLAAAAHPAVAETRTVRGTQLVLTDTLPSRTIIDTDPSLDGSIRLSAGGSLACLSVVSGPATVLSTAGCGDDLDGLRITVSPDTPVTMTGSGSGSIGIEDLNASLTATVTDSFALTAGHVGRLVLSTRGDGDSVVGAVNGSASLDMTGSGDLQIGHLSGPLSLRHRGSGDLKLGAADSPSVSIDSAGSGDTTIGRGTIGNLNAHITGSGDLTVAASVASGEVAASGGGDVKLSQVTGALSRSASGGSDITVDGQGSDGQEGASDGTDRVGRSSGESSTTRGHTIRVHPNWPTHLFTAAAVALMLYVVWRLVRRAGGVAALTGRSNRTPAGPLHPGVLAVTETLTRLEQRLGRLEGYVTTREFDLNRKFREL